MAVVVCTWQLAKVEGGPPIRRYPYIRRYCDIRRAKSHGETEEFRS